MAMAFGRIVLRRCSNAAVKQEEPKKPLLKRLGSYMKMVLDDYKMVAVETGQDMKDRPFKTAVILSMLGGVGYLIKTNPTERDFHMTLTQNANELMLVGEPIRNPVSNSHTQNLQWCFNEGLVRRFNLGVCSLIWRDNFAKGTDVYEAHCPSLKVGWLDMKDRILDIGIAGHWLWTEKAMIDYDINPTEWPAADADSKS